MLLKKKQQVYQSANKMDELCENIIAQFNLCQKQMIKLKVGDTPLLERE